jgi:beta-glucanase (GH16 family)
VGACQGLLVGILSLILADRSGKTLKIPYTLKKLCLTALLLFIVLIPQFKTEAQNRDLSYQSFTDGFDTFNEVLWYKANNRTNGLPFACGWRADHATVSGGKLTLQLNDENCPDGCSDQPYASGELRTNGFYHYGTYTVEMKAVSSSGVVSSFFIYTDSWDDGNPHDEIDIEILGKDPTKMQINYFANGTGGHEAVIDLGFDASADFHIFTIIWMPDTIEWYVDGVLKHAEDGSNGTLPNTPGRIMMNFWSGTAEVNDWLGDFTYTSPLQAQYDSVSYLKVEWQNKSYIPLIIH